MVDNMNPNSQFHPYQPVKDTASERQASGGIGDALNGSLNKVRDYARSKPGVLLGGLAALAIGAGLLRKRS
jgi:hypothetical protein